MNPLQQNLNAVLYCLFWISRIRGFQRRWQQPRLRGPEWFFDTRVEPGFYRGHGRELLRRYALRMALPCVLDVIALTVVAFTHKSFWLLIATLVLVPVIHLNHLFNVATSQREARAYAVPDEVQTLPAIGLSLAPRRLRDFSNRTVEIVFALGSTLPFLVLAHIYRSVPGRHDAHMVFWIPSVYLYLQLGALLVKQIIVTWRAPLPLQQTAEHRDVRDQMRRYYLLMCDWNRGAAVVGIVLWPVILSLPRQRVTSFLNVWGALWLLLCMGGAVWIEFRRKQLAELAAKTRPIQLPTFMGTAARWPVCFEPGIPLLLLQSERGPSLNLANTAAYLALAYLVGMSALLLLAKR